MLLAQQMINPIDVVIGGILGIAGLALIVWLVNRKKDS